MDSLPLIPISIAAFIATNTDDALLLLLYFGDRRFRARHIFGGQALGLGLLVLISLAGAALALVVPERWLGLLGLLPIALGVRLLLARRRHSVEPEAKPDLAVAQGASGWRRVAAVAGVTLANGGDNIGVYVPLFATRSFGEMALLLFAFAGMMVVWLFAAYYLARHSAVAGRLRRGSATFMPWILIALGMVILAEAFA